jgi:hypothetical protein
MDHVAASIGAPCLRAAGLGLEYAGGSAILIRPGICGGWKQDRGVVDDDGLLCGVNTASKETKDRNQQDSTHVSPRCIGRRYACQDIQ